MMKKPVKRKIRAHTPAEQKFFEEKVKEMDNHLMDAAVYSRPISPWHLPNAVTELEQLAEKLLIHQCDTSTEAWHILKPADCFKIAKEFLDYRDQQRKKAEK